MQGEGGEGNENVPPKQGQTNLGHIRLGTLSASTLESAVQKNLQVLDFKESKIASIPQEVYRAFPQVKVLDLRKNILEEILPAIASMESLEDLLLDQNRLREVPTEVCKLGKLKTLSLSQNNLRGLPKEIGQCTSLRSLSLGDNRIADIPAELGNCIELQTLYLHHNHFTKLPTTMHALVNISELALEWFRYTTPPLPRVIKGQEWKRIITKLGQICKERHDKGEVHLTCIDILSQFSQKTFDANAIDSKRRTRLHVACLEGHVGVAVSLAESGSKCDSLDCEGYSPLLVAVREEHPDIATALVRIGVDVNKGGGLFGSPLHVATVNFDPHMVFLLIKGRADVNQTDADGNTPLHVLMSVFDKGGKRAGAIGQILLRHGADCNLMNSDKWAPLHLAARRGQLRGICFVLNHIDSVSVACLRGTCEHQPAHKKSKSSRVRTCTRAFDLNLRGGSHLWTPLHLAGHACHVPVVQVLIEAGADVFLRNIDGRTARHVSRGNLAISKLLRKAEDEWLWKRIHQDSNAANSSAMIGITLGDDVLTPREDTEPVAPDNSPTQRNLIADEGLLESLKLDKDEEDRIEEIAKTIEGTSTGDSLKGTSATSNGTAQAKPPQGRKHDWILEKCCDTHFTKAELEHLQTVNFTVPVANIEEFLNTFNKVLQQGKHRLPFLFSKQWVKDMIPQLLEDEAGIGALFQMPLITNEDFIRMLVSAVKVDQMQLFGKVKNKEQETLLHMVCKGSSGKSSIGGNFRAEILAFLLTSCPPDTFEIEARDSRGQTALHLASQSGDIGLAQVLLENGADPNAQEDTTAWTPLHFAVAKAHYALILQLLHHDATNVNQVDRFDWPPLLEACSRLDARSTALLVNGGARLSFRNQHQFDVLKAVDTSKKDLAAKRWMSCLVVSNGFRFDESTVQLNSEDKDTLVREKAFFDSRQVPATHPPFYVPDHLAPRCHSCKVLFSVTVRRYHCRSCGLVLCGDCFKWRGVSIVALDERLRSRQQFVQSPDEEDGANVLADRVPARDLQDNRAGYPSTTLAESARPKPASGEPASASPRSEDSFEDPPLADELPAAGPPMTIISPASVSLPESKTPFVKRARVGKSFQGGLSRDRLGNNGNTRMLRLCAPCATFFEVGVGETYAMMQRKEAVHVPATTTI
mmetsp:Transcript_44668/g.103186  ORF Transcript_44668/g.103186 Transcript_44668/m.103186 type:complete len:1152 (-) Transcript_44668:26-3481(-)